MNEVDVVIGIMLLVMFIVIVILTFMVVWKLHPTWSSSPLTLKALREGKQSKGGVNRYPTTKPPADPPKGQGGSPEYDKLPFSPINCPACGELDQHPGDAVNRICTGCGSEFQVLDPSLEPGGASKVTITSSGIEISNSRALESWQRRALLVLENWLIEDEIQFGDDNTYLEENPDPEDHALRFWCHCAARDLIKEAKTGEPSGPPSSDKSIPGCTTLEDEERS